MELKRRDKAQKGDRGTVRGGDSISNFKIEKTERRTVSKKGKGRGGVLGMGKSGTRKRVLAEMGINPGKEKSKVQWGA